MTVDLWINLAAAPELDGIEAAISACGRVFV
jgi:hypothetical protein